MRERPARPGHEAPTLGTRAEHPLSVAGQARTKFCESDAAFKCGHPTVPSQAAHGLQAYFERQHLIPFAVKQNQKFRCDCSAPSPWHSAKAITPAKSTPPSPAETAPLLLATGCDMGPAHGSVQSPRLPSVGSGRRRSLDGFFESGGQGLPNWDCAVEAHFKRGEDRVSGAECCYTTTSRA